MRKINIGAGDQTIRLVVGTAVLALVPLVHADARWVAVIGLVPIVTALIRWCPVYGALGISTSRERA
jgi:hypothetical protein